MDANQRFEKWPREEVTAGHQEYLRDPAKAMPAENVLQHLKARRSRLRDSQNPEARLRR